MNKEVEVSEDLIAGNKITRGRKVSSEGDSEKQYTITFSGGQVTSFGDRNNRE